MELNKQGYKIYSREEIIDLIKEWYTVHGSITIRNLRHSNGLPSSTQVINMFGSFKECLLECGIELNNEKLFNRKSLSDDEMLRDFKRFVIIHLKQNITLPTYSDIDASDILQGSDNYFRRFNSISNLYSKIGYDMDEFNKNAIEKDMIKKYKNQCEINGHVLNSREIDRISKSDKSLIYASSSYISHFGSIHNLQQKCKFHKTSPGKGATKREMINQLKWLAGYLGRTPVQSDLILYKNVSSVSAYAREFGSFRSALKIAKLKSTKTLITKNGTMCHSTYELKLAQVLESYHIEFENETMYRDVIPNFRKRYRFDFVINLNNKKYYVELFGIEGNEKYNRRKEEKILLCKKHNIPLIQIYQSDIYSKTNKEIYNMLFNKTYQCMM